MTLHAAWKMDTEGASAARTGDRADQVLRREGAARRRRPRAAGRTARSATRPTCRWRRCTASRAPRGSTTGRRGAPPARRAPDPARLRAAADGVPTEHVPTRREAARAALRRPARGGDLERLGRLRRRARCAVALVGCGGGSPAARRRRRRDGRSAAAAPTVDRFDARPRVASCSSTRSSSARARRARRSRASSRASCKARLPHGRYREASRGGLRNVVGRDPGQGQARSCSPRTTTPRTCPGFVGANDGAGGTAAVLEIARALREAKRPKGAPPIRFVLFDGEEATDDTRLLGTGLRGSKAYANAAREADPRAGPARLRRREGRDADPARGELGPRAVGATCARAAERVGARRARSRTRPAGRGRSTTTRRSSQRGVPAIDLIDFTFPCWHKTCDDLTAGLGALARTSRRGRARVPRANR